MTAFLLGSGLWALRAVTGLADQELNRPSGRVLHVLGALVVIGAAYVVFLWSLGRLERFSLDDLWPWKD